MKSEKYPLSQSELGVFLACEKPTLAYNLPFLWELPESWDEEKLKEAIKRFFDLHPAMNLRFFRDEDGTPRKQIVPREPAFAVLGDISAEQLKAAPFDLEKDPLYRFAFCRADGKKSLFFEFHHILMDGRSVQLFLNDLNAMMKGEEPSAESFNVLEEAAQEAAARESGLFREAERYYADLLADAPDQAMIPFDKKGGTVSHRRLRRILRIKPQQVAAFTKRHGVRNSAFFLSAFAFLLAKMNASQDVCLATVHNGRSEKNANSVGMYVKTLPFRIHLDNAETVTDFLKKAGEQLTKSLSHNLFSFADAAEKLHASADILFAYQGDYMVAVRDGDQIMRVKDLEIPEGKGIFTVELHKIGDEYELWFEYRDDLYHQETIEQIILLYERVLEEFLCRSSLAEVDLLDGEQLRLLEEAQHPDFSYIDSDRTVLDYFHQNLAEAPDRPLVVCREKTVSYRQASETALRIASWLREKGAGREKVVSVLIPRSEYIMLASLGVLESGAAYQPLDPSYPPERLNFMIEDASACALILDRSLEGLVSYDGPRLYLDEIPSLPLEEKTWEDPSPSDLFIMLYTSGTTGKPKGVMLEHKNISVFSQFCRRRYAMDASCRSAAYASYGFDADMLDLYPPLISGGTVYIIPEDMRLDLMALADYYDEAGITHAFITTQVGRQFAELASPKTLKYLSVGGEKLVPLAPPEGYILYNLYGPTEGTVFCCGQPVDKLYHNIPIGPAIDTYRFYVLDEAGRRLPWGVTGELYISGPQLARGYLNRPLENEKAFLRNPFCQEPPFERLYRTGDMVRFLKDGTVDFVGRSDGQVKIRGFRVELAEVEQIIRRFPGIRDATVKDFTDPAGLKFIAAYVVSDETVDLDALRAFIGAEKPPYMIPASIMQIDAIPLTQNQKVNKRALPEPQPRETEIIPPENDTEQIIYDRLSAIIGHSAFGVTTDIFEAGLTSVSSIRFCVQLSRAFDKPFKNSDLAEHPTVRDLARLASEGGGGRVFEERPSYPLTKTQEGIFIECMSRPGSTVYNIPYLFRLDPRTEPDRLKKAVEDTLRAHPYAMSRLSMDENGDVVVLKEKTEPQVSVIRHDPDMAGLIRPFTLMGEPLYRAEIYLGREQSYLFLDFHHIFCDGTSEMILLSDISAAYDGKVPETEPYSGYEMGLEEQEERKTERLAKAAAYYEFLKDEESDCLPKKDLKTKNAGLMAVEMHPELSHARLAAYAEQNAVSLNAVFNFAFGITLSKFIYKDQALFTTIYNGRSDSRTVRTVSMLVKTLPVLLKYREEDRISELIRSMKAQLEASQQNDIFSFPEIAQTYGVTADILFVYHGGSFKLEKIGQLPVESIMLASDTPKCPLALSVFLEDGRFRFRYEYDSSMYNEASVSAFLRSFTEVLKQLDKAERIADLNYASETDLALYRKFNDTKEEIPPVAFHKMLEASAAKYPDKTAVIAQNGSFTYRELNENANRIAHALRERGVGTGDKVAVILPRVREAYAARQGVLKSGAAFVPIDPAYPNERVEYIIKESGARVVLVDAAVSEQKAEMLSRCGVPAVPAEELLSGGRTENPDWVIDPSELAYVIFTSGSTGKPKGVMITQRNLVNLCLDGNNVATEPYRILDEPVSYSFSSLSFDASVIEECVPLSHGYTAVIGSEEEIRNPMLMAKAVKKHHVNFMFMTPSYAANIVDIPAMVETLRGIKALVMGAESLSPELVQKLWDAGVTAAIYNGYGPTETTVGCTYFRVTDEYITIGRPVANTGIVLLDPHGHILPIGAVGDLTITGAGVGRGYMGLPEKTAEKFITVMGEPAFRSGDLARYNSEGNVEFFGRMDNQVKLRGLRVELDEIEKAILACEDISAAVVIVKNAPEGDYLAAYYTAGKEVDKGALTAFLSRSLTPYMVPKILIQLDKLPLTPNGKVDKRALPEPAAEELSRKGRAPFGDLEKKIAALFARALGVESVGADQDFFDLGGTSLSASKVAMLAVGAELPIAYKDVFDCPTVEALAAHVKALGAKEGAPQPEEAQTESAEGAGGGEEALCHNRIEEVDDIYEQRPVERALLTGATGFLGIHMLRELLLKDIPVLAMVRGGHELDAETRLKAMLMYYFDSPLEEEVSRLVKVVDADVTDSALDEKLKEEAFDTIFNCAAVVKHFAADDILDRVNVGGVENLIRLAMSRGARLVHISTISVAGENIDGKLPSTFRMKEYQLSFGQDISNKYINSKFKAEQAILARIPEGLDAKIVRVGNLMGRNSDGEFQINSVTNGFIRDLRSYQALGVFPVSRCDAQVDFSPIDQVAAAILKLASVPQKFTLFHAYNSHAVDMGDILRAMEECGFLIRTVPDGEFKRALSAMMEDPERNMLVSSLISYASSDRRLHEYVPADNRFTVKALYRLGFKWPITDERYMTAMISALASLDFFSGWDL